MPGLSLSVMLASIVAAMCLPLGGCDRHKEPIKQETPKFHLLASVYPLADIVRQVVGERAEVEWFCENGLDPRDLKLSAAQQHRARTGVDLIVTSGFQDMWAGDMMSSQQRSERLIRPEATATGRTYPDTHGCLWLDPRVAKEISDLTQRRMAVIDVRHEAEFRVASEKLIGEIGVLDSEFQRRLKPLAGKKFLALRPTWGPMAEWYGLKEIAPLDTEPQKLTDGDVAALKKAAKLEGIAVLAVDASLLPGVRRELERRTGLQLMLLDVVGTSAPDGRSTWVKLMRYNLEELERGLK
jgi:zinc transport system substrate-binding protein